VANENARSARNIIYALAGCGLLCGLGLAPNRNLDKESRPDSYVQVQDPQDGRYDLINKIYEIASSKDTAKEDPREERDSILTTRETVLLLRDLGIQKVVRDSDQLSIGRDRNNEKNLLVFLPIGNYSPGIDLDIDVARKYVESNSKPVRKK
jgi:hypothetical protein